MTAPNSMDVVGSLRKIARELTQINVEDPNDVLLKVGGASFMINWIADGLERELELAAQRGRVQTKEIPKSTLDIRCSCGDWSYNNNGTCGPNGCYNKPA